MVCLHVMICEYNKWVRAHHASKERGDDARQARKLGD